MTKSTPWEYQFPAIAEPEEMSKQLQHVKAEAQEAIEAYYEESAPWTLATELMDVIHAAETALRLLGMHDAMLNGVKRSVIAKNDSRGYYGGAK